MDQENITVIELSPWLFLIFVAVGVVLIVSASWYLGSLKPAISISMDKPEYSPGDLVAITGVLTGGGSPMVGADLAIEVKGPNSIVVWIDQVKTGQDGRYVSSFRLSVRAPAGEYDVYVSSSVILGMASFSVGNH